MEKFRFIQKAKLQELPKGPGVYAFSGKEKVLYIGKGANIRERAKNHFQQPTYRDHLFINEVTKIGYIETQSDIDALLLESNLIKQHQPKYNVMWRDDKGYFYVGITPSTSLRASKEPLPRVFLTHQPATKLRLVAQTKRSLVATKYIGPFVDGKAIKQVLRLLRKAFPYYTLRHGSGQAARKHGAGLCSWCHLNLCPGPSPDPKTYKKDLAKLIAVLQGKRTSVLKKLERDMQKASKEQHYEDAAKLRNQFWALERIMSHARLLVPETKVPLPEPWASYKRIEAYDISNIQGKEATGSLVVFIGGRPAKEWYRKFKIRLRYKSNQGIIKRSAGTPRYNARRSQAVGSDPNDFAMMQELLSRRLRHKEWPFPDLMVIDGGKPQLSAAVGQCQMSNVKCQIVALAKRRNELFFPGKPTSILLKTLPAPVQNLLLHIRDEAHRFAITYHRKLRRVDFFARS